MSRLSRSPRVDLPDSWLWQMRLITQPSTAASRKAAAAAWLIPLGKRLVDRAEVERPGVR